MGRSPRIWCLVVGLVALAEVGLGIPSAAPARVQQAPDPQWGLTEFAPSDGGRERWLRGALAVQASTRANLLATDRPDCADASYVSYRRSDIQPDVSDQWYVASQLWADAELLRAADD